MLTVTICGDTAIALSVAAISAANGHLVRVLSGDPTMWRPRVTFRLPGQNRRVACLERIDSRPDEALRGADVVLICVTHDLIRSWLDRIAPFVTANMLVGGVPGFGGFGVLAAQILGRRCVLFGTQRVPFVVRRHVSGQSVEVGGIRRQTFVGTIPAHAARPVAELVAETLGVRTVPVSHYLNIELSPSNSIVNPARLYALFGPNGTCPESVNSIDFFKEWDLDATNALLRMDDELQKGRALLPRDTSFVAPILLQYDSNDAHTLTDRIRRLAALHGRPLVIDRSMTRTVPDPAASYLWEDLDIGLTTVRDILHLAGAQTQFMDAVLHWRYELLPTSGRAPWAGRPRVVLGGGSLEELASALD